MVHDLIMVLNLVCKAFLTPTSIGPHQGDWFIAFFLDFLVWYMGAGCVERVSSCLSLSIFWWQFEVKSPIFLFQLFGVWNLDQDSWVLLKQMLRTDAI